MSVRAASIIATGLFGLMFVVSCGPKTTASSTAKAPYSARILQAHAVDYRTCFTQTPLADTAPGETPTNGADGRQEALVAIDSSGSMAGRIDGQTKMQVAREAVKVFARDLPAAGRVGLMIFGHKGANTAAAKALSCGAGAELVVPPTLDRSQINAALARLEPAGWTPLAAAIRSASQSLSGSGADAKVLYVVSDGLETCGGDAVAEARAANQGAQKIVVNVMAFGVPTAEQASLRAVAAAGGGSFMAVRDAQGLSAALRQAAEASVRGDYQNTAMTRGQNVVAVGSAVSKATYCVKDSLDRERQAAMTAIDTDEKAGRASGDEAAAARSLMNGRGDKALKALVAYSEALGTAEKTQAAAMWRRFEATRDELSPTSTLKAP